MVNFWAWVRLKPRILRIVRILLELLLHFGTTEGTETTEVLLGCRVTAADFVGACETTLPESLQLLVEVEVDVIGVGGVPCGGDFL